MPPKWSLPIHFLCTETATLLEAPSMAPCSARTSPNSRPQETLFLFGPSLLHHHPLPNPVWPTSLVNSNPANSSEKKGEDGAAANLRGTLWCHGKQTS